MNVNDSEVVHTVLQQAGYLPATSPETADVVLLNTCAIRDNAESKIWQRLGYFKNMKMSRRKSKGGKEKISSSAPQPPPPVVLGVLGCMAERLKHRLLESDKMVDIVAGPDAYRDIPRLIEVVAPSHDSQVAVADNNSNSTRAHAINVQLSVDETYADVIPVRPAGVKSVYLSVMRGCSNFCSFCVVPFTRGRERSRPLQSIVDEVSYNLYVCIRCRDRKKAEDDRYDSRYIVFHAFMEHGALTISLSDAFSLFRVPCFISISFH